MFINIRHKEVIFCDRCFPNSKMAETNTLTFKETENRSIITTNYVEKITNSRVLLCLNG